MLVSGYTLICDDFAFRSYLYLMWYFIVLSDDLFDAEIESDDDKKLVDENRNPVS